MDGPSQDGNEPVRIIRTTRTHLLCLSRAHNKFSIQLYQEFAKDGKRPGNFVISPVSVSLGLGMIHIGARGSSREELNKSLHLHEVQDNQLLPAYAALHWDVTKTAQPRGGIFEFAIRLFAQPGHVMTAAYERICSRYDITRMKNVDFRNRPDLARKEINQWAEEKTHGRVKDVLPTGIADTDTSLLLLCATYAKLSFLYPFDKKKTTCLPFYLHMEAPQVPMMYQRRCFRMAFIYKLDCDILELPLSSGELKFLVLLPRRSENITRLEMKLSRSVLDNALDRMQEELVDVYLPKFRYELGIICWDALVKLGIKNLYISGKADFSGLDGTTSLFLSRVFHHLCFEIDEGASTPATEVNSSIGPDTSVQQQVPKIFRADHPFLFLVIEERTAAIHFIGRVFRPQTSSVASVT
ncbi:hypothetical protein HELRODRAFT_66915 [Helobdella robusta]|uniref:Serpin domain-containing protein n=1 Tax=Helobdella robusta TaxID=6412 RepID=T1FYS8_HELRO|nr:hypothetical protein HELRODRAFT_66915 [Helobdella robusta]ESN99158.1 hypothetical protein HELRODRAFT_66915 [Helobdella robusta]